MQHKQPYEKRQTKKKLVTKYGIEYQLGYRPLFRQPLFSRSSSTQRSFYHVLTLTLTIAAVRIVVVGIAAVVIAAATDQL